MRRKRILETPSRTPRVDCPRASRSLPLCRAFGRRSPRRRSAPAMWSGPGPAEGSEYRIEEAGTAAFEQGPDWRVTDPAAHRHALVGQVLAVDHEPRAHVPAVVGTVTPLIAPLLRAIPHSAPRTCSSGPRAAPSANTAACHAPTRRRHA